MIENLEMLETAVLAKDKEKENEIEQTYLSLVEKAEKEYENTI